MPDSAATVPFEDDWTIRQHIACWIHQLAFLFAAPEHHELIVHDPDGAEFFSVAFEGGFVASHPPVDSGYKLFCLHGDDLQEM